jgi:hypothetical protein
MRVIDMGKVSSIDQWRQDGPPHAPDRFATPGSIVRRAAQTHRSVKISKKSVAAETGSKPLRN